MRAVSLLIVASLFLAGCAGDGLEDEPEPTEGPDDADAPPADDIPRPEWNAGDWWTYDITIARDFAGLPWTTTLSPTIVVVEADARNGYWTAVTTREDAVTRQHWGDVWGGNHTLDLDPRVPVDEADGTRSEQVAELFQWPLALNATWKGAVKFGYGGATVEGLVDFTVTAFENATVLDDEDRVATVVGRADLTTSAAPDPEPYTIEYVFAEDVGNVVSLSIANATLSPLSMTLTDSGSNYTGDAFLLGFDSLYFGLKIVAPGATTPQTAPHPETFEQESGYSFMDVFFGIGLYSQGRVAMTVVDPDGANEATSYDRMDQAVFLAVQHPSVPGTWTVSYQQTALSFAAVGVGGVHETVLNFVDGAPAEPA